MVHGAARLAIGGGRAQPQAGSKNRPRARSASVRFGIRYGRETRGALLLRAACAAWFKACSTSTGRGAPRESATLARATSLTDRPVSVAAAGRTRSARRTGQGSIAGPRRAACGYREVVQCYQDRLRDGATSHQHAQRVCGVVHRAQRVRIVGSG